MATKTSEPPYKSIKDYYGKVLEGSESLQTNACCTEEAIPQVHKNILSQIHDDILTKFYGCGSPIPPGIEQCTILDLGCGTGRDAYLLSKLVGPGGSVIGIDMTTEQIAVAKKHKIFQTKKFGYKKPNVQFKEGYMEDLKSVGIKNESVDIVTSNCVINLSPEKERVFGEIFRVLKPGGELYFSDVFSNKRVPESLRYDPVLQGECLSGALYVEDFRRILRQNGCLDYRVISKSPVTISNPELEKKIGMIGFSSLTIRAFKLDTLEDICEDYGQVAVYSGTIVDHPHNFRLDDHHNFITGKPELVCGNTASMLSETRLRRHFKVSGNKEIHYGPFDCAPEIGSESSEAACC